MPDKDCWNDYLRRKKIEEAERVEKNLEIPRRVIRNIRSLKSSSDLGNRLSILNGRLEELDIDILKKIEELRSYANTKCDILINVDREKYASKALSEAYFVSSYCDSVIGIVRRRALLKDFYEFLIDFSVPELMEKVFNREAYIRMSINFDGMSFKDYLEKHHISSDKNVIDCIKGTPEYRELTSKTATV